jgi:uncharacterized protein DUF1573
MRGPQSTGAKENMRVTVFLLVIMVAGRSAFAGCKWESTDQTVDAALTDSEANLHFKFSNVGSNPITIAEVKPSCGCTTAKIGSKIVYPGESGEIDFSISLGSAVGVQNKSAAIAIIDGDQKLPPIELKMHVRLPDPLTISPAFVSWDKGETPSPKTIHVVSNLKKPFHILSVESSFQQIQTVVVTVKDGVKYDITVTPVSTNKRFFGALLIHTDVPSNGVEKRFEFDAAVN